jgi:hypothetical protein
MTHTFTVKSGTLKASFVVDKGGLRFPSGSKALLKKTLRVLQTGHNADGHRVTLDTLTPQDAYEVLTIAKVPFRSSFRPPKRDIPRFTLT